MLRMAKGRRRQVSQEGAETSCRSRVGIPETTPPPTIHYNKDSGRIQGGKTLVDTGVFAPLHGDASDQGLPRCRSGASLWACELARGSGCTPVHYPWISTQLCASSHKSDRETICLSKPAHTVDAETRRKSREVDGKRLGRSDAVHKLCVTGRTIRVSEAVIGRIRPISLRKCLPGHP